MKAVEADPAVLRQPFQIIANDQSSLSPKKPKSTHIASSTRRRSYRLFYCNYDPNKSGRWYPHKAKSANANNLNMKKL